jgi:hypothetical protein
MNKFNILKAIPYLLLVGYSFVQKLITNNGAIFREYVYLVSKIEKTYYILPLRVLYIALITGYIVFLVKIFIKRKHYGYLLSLPIVITVLVMQVLFKDHQTDLYYVLKVSYYLAVFIFDIFITIICLLIEKGPNYRG